MIHKTQIRYDTLCFNIAIIIHLTQEKKYWGVVSRTTELKDIIVFLKRICGDITSKFGVCPTDDNGK